MVKKQRTVKWWIVRGILVVIAIRIVYVAATCNCGGAS